MSDSFAHDEPTVAMAPVSHLRIGEILVRLGKVSPAVVESALTTQEEKGGLVGEILLGLKAIKEMDLLQALGLQFSMAVRETIDMDGIDPALVADMSIQYAKHHMFIPLEEQEDGSLVVAVTDPLDLDFVSDLEVMFDKEIEPVLVPREQIEAGINKVFDRLAAADKVVEDIATDDDIGDLDDDLEELTDIIEVGEDEAPIIRLVNSVLRQAVKEQASDIHVEAYEKHIAVRFRKDGVLHPIIEAPKKLQASIASRIKIMGNLNIAEKRVPQDGRIRRKVAGRDIDIRLSTVPTSFGERLVMRILDKTATILDLKDLGFGTANLAMMEKLIRRPHGIILVTGPTGSGKTTTLYAALSRINTPDKNILTVEDPVEYQLPGIGQMQVNPKIEFTFASGLRAILRQDPDVVLVGEIRDVETAEIAVQASLTGHLVFSTVHTNDSASTFTRLIDMGVEPFLISSSVIACLAQRLVRKVCSNCKVPYTPLRDELIEMGLDPDDPGVAERTVYRAEGCDVCGGTGYKGRLGIYELMITSDEVRQMVMNNIDATRIKRKAVEDGMRTLRNDGALKVLQGVTTIEEVMRVTQEDAL